MSALDEYDLAIYPGFYRRPSVVERGRIVRPMARAREPGEAFQPLLKQGEIDEDRLSGTRCAAPTRRHPPSPARARANP